MIKGKKIAIVTGATGGLGREFVRLLLKEKNVEHVKQKYSFKKYFLSRLYHGILSFILCLLFLQFGLI